MSTTYFRQIGPYEIHEAVGRGGMGHVFLAQDTRAGGARVALVRGGCVECWSS